MKNTICIILCAALSLAFLAGGIFALISRDNKLKENEAAIKQLRQEQDTLVKEDCTQEISDVQQNNTQLQQQIDTLKTECDQLDENNVALQQEYETLSQDENTIYYLTVLESLKKGMEKVESYINNAQ